MFLSSLASALHYMGDGYASEYITRRKQKYLSFINKKGQMQFCRDTLMGQYREKKNKKYIIKFRNGIHAQRHMIYCIIILIIQLCVCYLTWNIRLIVVLLFAVNGYLILIWNSHYQSKNLG